VSTRIRFIAGSTIRNSPPIKSGDSGESHPSSFRFYSLLGRGTGSKRRSKPLNRLPANNKGATLIDLARATQGLNDKEVQEVVNMATYAIFGVPLNRALGEYADFGFRLEKGGDDHIELYFKDKHLWSIPRDKVSIGVIQDGCKSYLKSIARNE